MSPLRLRQLWAVAFTVGLLGNLIVLFVPQSPGVALYPHTDKVVHFLVFCVPAVCGLLAGWPRGWVLGALTVHAGASEVIQGLVLPNRDGSVADLIADLIGVAVAALVVGSRRRSRGRSGGQ